MPLVWAIYLCIYLCRKSCMSDFSAFVLNLSKSGNVLFSQMEIVCSVQHHCHWWEITHWCRNFEWWSCWVELHVNATYTQHPALKSVYGKDQSVIAISYFPPIGQFLAQSLLETPRQVTWIASMKHLPREKH